MDKIDLLMQADALAASVEIPFDAIVGFNAHANVLFNSPVISYLSGSEIESAKVGRTMVDGIVYTIFYHEEEFGRTPSFFTLQSLEDFLLLMLQTPRSISIEEVETTQDVVLSNGRSGLFAVVSADLPVKLRLGKIDEDVTLRSVRDERDIPEAGPGQIVVRCEFSVWDIPIQSIKED